MSNMMLVEPETRQAWEMELIRLAAQTGELTAEVVVDAAKAKTSALHGMLCWDNTQAAHEFRLAQARSLIRRVVVYLVNADEDESHTRQFVSVKVNDSEGERRSYVPLAVVMQSVDFTAQMLSDAKRDLTTFRNKYAVLSELVKVFSAIDDLIQPETKRISKHT